MSNMTCSQFHPPTGHPTPNGGRMRHQAFHLPGEIEGA